MNPLFEVLRKWPEGFDRLVSAGPWIDDAIRHGVASWIAESLSLGKQPVPRRLAEAARSQLLFGRKHRKFTLDVVSALNAGGVTPVLLKGYGLASRLYPSPLARPAIDVDVFVSHAALHPAQRSLAGLGLTQQHDAGLEDPLEDHHHQSWAAAPGLVEVHHRLASGFGGEWNDEEAILARARPATLDGQRVLYLSAEDELLYLAVHAANHAFLRLSWLVDVKRFLGLVAVDWALLGFRAREAELLRPLRVTLALAERLAGARLPPDAERALALRSARALVDPIVFSEERVASASWASKQVPSFLLHLYLAQTPRQIARHVFAGAKRALRRARSHI